MDINIETLTRNLSEYSMEANNASIAISKGLQPVGIAILIIFFCVELLSWKNLLNKNDKKLVVGLWGEFSLKYLIGFILLMSAPYILDAIMDISILITKKINSIYPPSTYSVKYDEADYGGWFLNAVLNGVGYILEKIAKAIVFILIFMRYIDLYFLKALAPILIGFYFSDEFRGVVMNYFKTFIAYSLLGVVLLLITVIFGMVITQDFIKVATNNDSAWTGFLILIKEVIYILLIAGSVAKTKRLVGVQ